MYYRESMGSAFKRGYDGLPSAIRTIITINAAVFLLQVLSFGVLNNWMNTWLGFDPQPLVALTQPWRLLTYQFLHAHVFHILFNMLWLWWMGRPVEEHMGSQNFWAIYLASGIGGALLSVLVSPVFGSSLTIGASGAVFGIMVAFAMLYPTAPIMMFLLPPIEARWMVAGLVFLDVIFITNNDNTARVVHLGGAAIGYLMMKYYSFGTDFSGWIRPVQTFFGNMTSVFGKKVRRNSNMRIVEDAEVIEEVEQSELDRILDKISKKGYDGLNADEKKILFELSKKK